MDDNACCRWHRFDLEEKSLERMLAVAPMDVGRSWGLLSAGDTALVERSRVSRDTTVLVVKI